MAKLRFCFTVLDDLLFAVVVNFEAVQWFIRGEDLQKVA